MLDKRAATASVVSNAESFRASLFSRNRPINADKVSVDIDLKAGLKFILVLECQEENDVVIGGKGTVCGFDPGTKDHLLDLLALNGNESIDNSKQHREKSKRDPIIIVYSMCCRI